MEKYYIITAEAPIYAKYYTYIANVPKVRKHVKHFFSEWGISATEYYASNTELGITCDDKDYSRFNNILTKKVTNGVRKFHKNSVLYKSWMRSLKDANLQIIPKPSLTLYFECWGRVRYRLFHKGNTLYGSMGVDMQELKSPKGFTEIPASTFYTLTEAI